MMLQGWDCGLSGAVATFVNDKFQYFEDMPIRKVITREKIMQFDLKDGKKQIIKSGPNKGQAKMKVRRPEKTKNELDTKRIMSLMSKADVIVIERQNPRPGNSASSSFTTGVNFGKLLACAELSGAKIVLVNPNTWKSYLGLSQNKLDSVEMAERLTGESFRTERGRLQHDASEAMLIGHWFLTKDKKEQK
jgi:hypothetical protein